MTKINKFLPLLTAFFMAVQMPGSVFSSNIVAYADDDDDDETDYTFSDAFWEKASDRAVASWEKSYTSQSYTINVYFEGRDKKLGTVSGGSGNIGTGTADCTSIIANYGKVGYYYFQVKGSKYDDYVQSDDLEVTKEMISSWGGVPKDDNEEEVEKVHVTAEESENLAKKANQQLSKDTAVANAENERTKLLIDATAKVFGTSDTQGKFVHFSNDDEEVVDLDAWQKPDMTYAMNEYIKYGDYVYYIASDMFLDKEERLEKVNDSYIYFNSLGQGLVVPDYLMLG